MAYAKLTESQLAQGVFAAFDHAQSFTCDRSAILDARRKTGRGGLVPDPQSGGVREVPDVLLREPSVEQRGCDAMLAGVVRRGPDLIGVLDVPSLFGSLRIDARPESL